MKSANLIRWGALAALASGVLWVTGSLLTLAYPQAPPDVPGTSLDYLGTSVFSAAYLGELGAELEVVRNDVETTEALLERRPDRVIVSPGPCTPNEAGVSVEVMRRFPEAGIPTLGVCLGHQSLAQAFGGTVVRHEPVHGKTTEITHDGTGLFAGLPSPLTVGRYHSLVVDPQLPECLMITATGGGVVMGVRHRDLPAHGVQFHPESVLTPEGKRLLENFLAEPGSD